MLLVVVVCLAAWQVWLTIRLLDQDRNLAVQRSHERLGQVADLAIAHLKDSFYDWELALHELTELPAPADLQAQLPGDSTFILITRNKIQIYPQRPLLFTPVLQSLNDQSNGAFETTDGFEFREHQYERAVETLLPLTHNLATRAEALMRKARIELKLNQREAALATYKALAGESANNPSGTPYALMATIARYRIFTELGSKKEASVEAETVHTGLSEGRWPLSRESFEYHWSELNRLGISNGPPPQSAIDFSSLVSVLYQFQWGGSRSQDTISSGRESVSNTSMLVYTTNADRLGAVVTSADSVLSSLKLPANSADIQWKLLPPGVTVGADNSVTRTLVDVKFPLRVAFSSTLSNSGQDASRRRLLLGGATLMILVLLGSGYVVQRAISRELQVAQLQTDFVAAVSHEFRTPLTTLRTIAELLAQNRFTDEARRNQSYVYLERETRRLSRLVEDLLDFGRMESGRNRYYLQSLDAFQLVRSTLADFSGQAESQGFRVEAEFDSNGTRPTATIEVDEEAFKRALRNLIDNAMKYSPVCRTVWVAGEVRDREVLISVRDQGMGISAKDGRAIFEKFVRGDAAKHSRIKGTGIGLAMVQQISKAMGGEVRLQSEVGVGSTFTIVLPLADN